MAPVPFLQLFKYASREDLVLLGTANLFILYSSLNIPLVNIVYGLMMREMNDYVARRALFRGTVNLFNASVDESNKSYLSTTTTTSASFNLTPITYNGTFRDAQETFINNSYSLCMIVIVFGITRFLALYLALLFFSRAASNQAKRVRALFFRSLLRQEVAWFERNRTGDFAIRITSDLSKFEDGIGEKIALCLNALFAWMSSLISSFYYGWELTLVCLVLVPLTIFITTVIAEFQASYSIRESSALSRAFNVCHEVISSIRTVLSFSGQQMEAQRFKKGLDSAYKYGLKRNMFAGLNLGFTWMSGYLGFAICLLYSTKFYKPEYYGHYDEAHIITILWSAAGCVFLLNRMMPFIEIIQMARGSASNLFAVIERTSLIDATSDVGLRPVHFEANVEFSNVHFTYPSETLTAAAAASGLNAQQAAAPQQATLEGVCMQAKSGQTIALVGPSGSGKSTALALLQRFYEIQHGCITLGGHNLRDLNLGWLRGQFGVVTQEPVLFDMSIADNIRLGARPGQSVSDYDVEQAARNANAHAFISRLPHGYETRAGARGVQLSGGQKQRIAIARALVRQPKILLLDEATSALDLESESIVQKALDQARIGRTTFVVAHRLSTVRNADKIVVFNKGTIVETGTHDELIHKRGLYYQINAQQKQGIDLLPANSVVAGCTTTNNLLTTTTAGQAIQSGARRNSQIGCGTLSVAGAVGGLTPGAATASTHLDQYTRESRSLSIYSTTGKYATAGGGFSAAGHGGNGEGVDNGGSCCAAIEPPNVTCDDDFYNRPEGDDDDEDEELDEYRQGADALVVHEADEHATDDTEPLPNTAADAHKNHRTKQQQQVRCRVSAASGDTLTQRNRLRRPATSQQHHKQQLGQDETQASLLDGESLSFLVNSKGKRVSHLSVMSVLKFIKPDALWSLVGIVASLLMGLCIPISAMIIGNIATIFATDNPNEIRTGLFSHGLMYTVLALFAFVVSFIQVLSFGLAGERIGIQLRLRGFQAIMQHELAWFDQKRNNPGSICARLASDVGNVQSITGNRTAVIFQSISILVSTFTFAVYFNLKFSSICAMFVAILLISTVMQARYAGKLAHANRTFDSQIGKIVLESSANIKTLVSLHQESYFIERCEQLLQRDKRATSLDNHMRLSLESLKYAMTAISKGSSFYFAAGMLLQDEISIDVIFKLIEIILYGLTEASKSLIFLSDLEKARRGTQNLYKLIYNNHHVDYNTSSKPSVAGHSLFRHHSATTTSTSKSRLFKKFTSTTTQQTTQSFANVNYHNNSSLVVVPANSNSTTNLSSTKQQCGALKFNAVRFHYPTRPDACVLKSFSVDIPAGKSVALVGRSGCGKSTIVQLLERFYAHASGSIQLDGVELRKLPAEFVRKQIALVSQEPSLLSYTIGDNIRYGDTSRDVPFEEVVRAAQVANIHEFIMSLPDGYDTQLSEANSVQLSGGQKQRIAIARALVRQAPILIFDEATSALDTNSEQIVQDALDRARAGKTCIIIAHRLSTIQSADLIVVLRDGQVVEQGTHQELLERRGEYYCLYKTQSKC